MRFSLPAQATAGYAEYQNIRTPHTRAFSEQIIRNNQLNQLVIPTFSLFTELPVKSSIKALNEL
ncbi:hypothetical protein GCM10007932_49650 [Vibrio penaeicida]|uniref:Uncharacterized protein n=1 Tax=Vibrio penaeicida TaxID=104609 RepID=A0AAV5NZ09_9VIBR|nr:hypothetical protein GCM10007932_49650 [Vibrio penaeicida]